MPLTFTNLSIQRSFGVGGRRTLQVRFDAQNIFNRQQWQGPTLNPTSTQFGQVTTVALNQMRFFTFGVRATFRAVSVSRTPLARSDALSRRGDWMIGRPPAANTERDRRSA